MAFSPFLQCFRKVLSQGHQQCVIQGYDWVQVTCSMETYIQSHAHVQCKMTKQLIKDYFINSV